MFRNDDILCRLGGDEFMILCRNIDEISIRMKLEDVTRQMKIPYLIEEYQIMAPLSIGFVMIPLYSTTFHVFIQMILLYAKLSRMVWLVIGCIMMI